MADASSRESEHVDLAVCEKTRDIIARYPDKTGQVINVLNDVQAEFQYLPEEALIIVAEQTGTSLSQLQAMGSFFKSLSTTPVGKYIIEVCDGTACHAVGARRIVDLLEDHLGIAEGETTADGLVTLRRVHCVGACGLAPIIIAGKRAFGHVRLTDVTGVVDKVVSAF